MRFEGKEVTHFTNFYLLFRCCYWSFQLLLSITESFWKMRNMKRILSFYFMSNQWSWKRLRSDLKRKLLRRWSLTLDKQLFPLSLHSSLSSFIVLLYLSLSLTLLFVQRSYLRTVILKDQFILFWKVLLPAINLTKITLASDPFFVQQKHKKCSIKLH